MKKTLVAIAGILAAIYLIYPSLGIFELIPDAIPFVGSLDEGGATVILLSSLAYFGIDLRSIFGKKTVECAHIEVF